MDPIHRVLTILRSWNEHDPTVAKEDGTRELVTKTAISKIVSISPKELEGLLNTIGRDPEHELLLDKIDIFREILIRTGGCDLRQVEAKLGLTEWDAGPNTEIAKKRIIDCYLLKSNELDLSGLSVSGPLPSCIASLDHLIIVQCQNNYLTKILVPTSVQYLDCCDNPYLISAPKELPELNVFLCINCPNLVLPEVSKLPKVRTLVSDTIMFGETETWLHLRDWDAGPNTAEAKERIIACYESGGKELDLSGLELTKFPPHLNRLQLTHLNYSGNRSRVPKDLGVKNLIT